MLPSFDEFRATVVLLLENLDQEYFGLSELVSAYSSQDKLDLITFDRLVAQAYIDCLDYRVSRRILNSSSA